jgi:hypothetical protein
MQGVRVLEVAQRVFVPVLFELGLDWEEIAAHTSVGAIT